MKQQMPIGVDDFKTLREKNYYFVDKTDFIRELIDGHSQVTLITRPRRFGKTLNMSMLSWFFSITQEKQSRNLFAGLAIEKAGVDYMKHRGQYPVLFFSLKDFSSLTWEQMQNEWRLFLQDLFLQYDFLRDTSKVQPELVERFQNLVEGKANLENMSKASALLLRIMHQYYGKKVILLLDEYDAPIEQAWENGFYKEGIAFMKQFLGSALKGNSDLEFAILTGVLRVAKESIFSGLNNLDVCSILRDKYSLVFGFTEQETKALLVSQRAADKLTEVKKWYDGYRIGNQEIYNPWSVVNYVANERKPRPYWVRTSENGILKELLVHADTLRVRMVQGLLEDKPVRVTLDEGVIYPEIGKNPAALFTMMLTTGYLTIQEVISEMDERYALRIPNEEIKRLYRAEILNHLAKGINKNTFDNLFDSLLLGETEYFALQLQEILRSVVSVYDAANKESFYHGFMLGMTALFLDSSYQVESNRESGYGRFDLAIFPQDKKCAGVIMEFKVAATEDELPAKAEEALQQIEKRAYVTEFSQRGIVNVWKYGIAFCGKKIAVLSNTME